MHSSLSTSKKKHISIYVFLKTKYKASTPVMLSRRACQKLGQLKRPQGKRSISTSQAQEGSGSGRRYVAMWGNGDYGRLGLGSLDSQWTPKPLLSRTPAFKSIACGGAHTLFLTETGRVYACGLNEFGQLGVSSGLPYSVEPLEVCGLQKEIVHISAGYHHSCAITGDGELYMWGRNSSGQLGLGKKAKTVVPEPTRLDGLSGVKIKMVALGSEHTISVSEDGETLSWGGGSSGQLGHDHKSSFMGILESTSEYTPRLIKALERIKVKSVGAGLLHSACVDEKGTAFAFGEIAGGTSVGLKRASNKETISAIGEMPNSEIVACGGYHICVITSGGELYTWGSNENGCLGIGCMSIFHFPERVEGPFQKFPVDKVSCGWKHTAAISGGNIFTWGWGGSHGTFSDDGHSSGGQLGHGDDVDYLYPRLVEFEKNVKAIEVSCGFNHTGAILEVTENESLIG